jgi:antitoxin MazE
MQVSRWGNSLAVRLPAALVEELKLKVGDDIEICVAGTRNFELKRKMTREEAIESLRRLSRPMPEGYKFRREDAYPPGRY